MYSTDPYFDGDANRRVVVTKRTLVPNPGPTVFTESESPTSPTTRVVYESHGHEHPIHPRKLGPAERQIIRDSGYARGVDLYESTPYDYGMREPRSMHGRWEKVVGHAEEMLGRITRNPARQATGEEKIGYGSAEVESAAEWRAWRAEELRREAEAIERARLERIPVRSGYYPPRSEYEPKFYEHPHSRRHLTGRHEYHQRPSMAPHDEYYYAHPADLPRTATTPTMSSGRPMSSGYGSATTPSSGAPRAVVEEERYSKYETTTSTR